MEELKACANCGGAAKRMEDTFVLPTNKIIFCENCKIRTSPCVTWKEAEDIWNRRAAPENKPLTLERLEATIESYPKDWLWLEDLTDGNNSTYQRNDKTYRWSNITNYGKTWLAYGRRPEAAP